MINANTNKTTKLIKYIFYIILYNCVKNYLSIMYEINKQNNM